MSEYGNERCHECDGMDGNHYPGCNYDGMGSSGGYYHVPSGGGSTIGAILCVVGGLVMIALLFTVFGVEVSECPVIILIILWIVFTSILVAVVDTIRKRSSSDSRLKKIRRIYYGEDY